MLSHGLSQTLIRDVLVESFSKDEIKSLCFELEVEFENLAGETKSAKAQELVVFMHRNGKLQRLVSGIVLLRPDLEGQLLIQSNTIPFVIMAMTDQEAKDLDGETVFDNAPLVDGLPVALRGNEKAHFLEYKSDLPTNALALYGATREDWSPYGGVTIREVIEQITRSRNYEPQFFSERLFDDSQEVRRQASYELQLSGGILLIDAVSLFHPKLHFLLRRSNLISARESVAALIVSPVDYSRHSLNRIVESLILSSQLSVVLHRFEQLDLMCEIGIGGPRNLRRWLYTILPRAAEIVRKERASSARLERFSLQLDYQKMGIHNFFTGRR